MLAGATRKKQRWHKSQRYNCPGHIISLSPWNVIGLFQWRFKAAWASSMMRVSLARQSGSGTCGKAADAER